MLINQVIVLFGGESNERHVSVASAQYIAQCLSGVLLWFISQTGQIYSVSPSELENHKNPFTETFEPQSVPLFNSLEEVLHLVPKHNYLFVLALHGQGAEDGKIQWLLEQNNCFFTGSGSNASRLGFDKVQSKRLAQKASLAIAPSINVNPDEETDVIFGKMSHFLTKHGKIVAKPTQEGSSVGLTFIHNKNQINAFITNDLFHKHKVWIIEAFLPGREITVGVREKANGDIVALPCTEFILGTNNQFDYHRKYLSKPLIEITPAELDQEITDALQQAAVTIHQAIGCRGYSRSDFIINQSKPYFLEINTLPGLAKRSVYPQQLNATGVEMSEFLFEQILIAKNSRHNPTVQYSKNIYHSV
jgi:D-alanine-D-alanine ligase